MLWPRACRDDASMNIGVLWSVLVVGEIWSGRVRCWGFVLSFELRVVSRRRSGMAALFQCSQRVSGSP